MELDNEIREKRWRFFQIIVSALKQYPDLTKEGFGLGEDARKLPPEEQVERSKLRQLALCDDADREAFENCCAYIDERIKRAKNSHPAECSYVLKSKVERKFGCYVANGIFVVAAIYKGLQVKRLKRSCNAAIKFYQPS